MTQLNNDWEFNLQEELDRKTIEALESLNHQHRSGRISDAEYRGALKGINAAVRGLVPEEFTLEIDQEVSLLPDKERRSAIYASAKAVYLLSMTVGEDYFIVRTVPAGAGKKVVRGEGSDPVADATRKFREFEAKLAANSYKKL